MMDAVGTQSVCIDLGDDGFYFQPYIDFEISETYVLDKAQRGVYLYVRCIDRNVRSVSCRDGSRYCVNYEFAILEE